jgi:hypothetical protein
MMSDWETMMRYTCGYRIVESKYNSLQAWARRELTEGIQWLADEFRLEAREMMQADDDGMPAKGKRQ